MSETCVVPVDLVVNSEGCYEYVLCGRPASLVINGWCVCAECRSTYPKSWPSIPIEGAE
jgi:hypothetical protein